MVKKVLAYTGMVVYAVIMVYSVIFMCNYVTPWLFGVGIPTITAKSAERYLEKDFESFSKVAEYLESLEGDNVRAWASEKTNVMRVGGEEVDTKNSPVFKHLSAICDKGYVINKKGGGGVITFMKWASWTQSHGIAYSIDGSGKVGDFLVDVKPLSKRNWYYYKKSHNEYEKGKRPEPYDIPKEWGYESDYKKYERGELYETPKEWSYG
ncbi:MAG: hypothetical protein FWH04_08310 [Oscillospiraceae bacterium]|nr:hypothetical protein [Oscillospiraceae bacterium]